MSSRTNPCCESPDPCCNADDPCCGDPDPCCNADNPCCGNPDPCCDPDSEACLCDDGDSCTEDSIDPGSGQCIHPPLDCDDGDASTVDHCALGNCTHESILLDCDDGNLCTEDSCNPATGECDNVPTDCDDGLGCTEDCCDPPLGCLHFPTAQPFTIQAFEDTSGCVGGTLGIPVVICNDGQCDKDFDWSVTGTTSALVFLPPLDGSVNVPAQSCASFDDLVQVQPYRVDDGVGGSPSVTLTVTSADESVPPECQEQTRAANPPIVHTKTATVRVEPVLQIISVAPAPTLILGSDLSITYEVSSLTGTGLDAVDLEVRTLTGTLVFVRPGSPGRSGHAYDGLAGWKVESVGAPETSSSVSFEDRIIGGDDHVHPVHHPLLKSPP